ncbi:MAG: hypothetical protein RBU37_25790 [Myxococcota bacterium]|nr:hypothetical protein [Myxococcota bacterium]
MLLPFLVAMLLLLILVVSMLGSGDGDVVDEGGDLDDGDARISVQDRVATLVRALDQHDSALAERRLQSMGPVVISALLSTLRSLDEQRNALSVEQQLRIERILIDFGPQTLRVAQRQAGRIHRASAAFPALIEVLSALGVDAVRVLASSAVSSCLLARLGTRLERQLEPADFVALLLDSDKLCRACARSLGRRSELRHGLLAQLPLDDARRLWLEGTQPKPEGRRAMLEEAALADTLTALEQNPERFENWRALSGSLEDPRVEERFLQLVESPTEENLELVIWAMQALLQAKKRLPEQSLSRCLRLCPKFEAMRRLQAIAAQVPSQARHAFNVCIKSPSIEVQRSAVHCAARLEDDVLLPLLLRALGRHRFSELEDHLAAPILLRFDALLNELSAFLRSSDEHELRLAALDLLVFHGEREELPLLLEMLGQRDYLDHLIANALESLGEVALTPLTDYLDTVPNGRLRELLSRRLDLLRRRIAMA